MAAGAQEKTEKATPRRIKEARRKGQVARSTDLTGALCLLAMVALFYAINDQLIYDLRVYLTGYFSQVGHLHIFESRQAVLLNNAASIYLKLITPFLGTAFIVVVAANLVQVGFLFASESLKPKVETLNPMSGLQRMFSTRSAVELIKSILKLAMISGVTYLLIKGNLDELLLVFSLPPEGIYRTIVAFILKVAWWGALAYLVLALCDYMYQRYEYDKSLKMDKHEVKEEFKQSEGDPLVKSRQREMRHSMSLNNIISEVPQATVVITNPTHLAVALLYKQGEMSAPRLVAKGAGWLAEKIKEIARLNGVPVIENKEVARFLFQNVDVGREIPLEVYQAVAQVLALVYRLKAKENYKKTNW